MNQLFTVLLPELILAAVACVLMLFGATRSRSLRIATPWVALIALAAAAIAAWRTDVPMGGALEGGTSVAITHFSLYIKLLAAVIGALLVLLNWPTEDGGERNSSLSLETEGPEYFGLMLLSFMGIMLVASANDLITLFIAIEMASIPTYVMVSISRPIAVAQEAAVKYFFLGAFSAALQLFGLSFLFGATGSLGLSQIAHQLSAPGAVNAWVLIAGMMITLGLAFKLAAFPLHFYATDVYTGAATPLTALLSFVPKTAGMAAIIKVLAMISGGNSLPAVFTTLLWVIAVCSMTIGNVLGLMQHNIKRLMACSSIAHSGYMLVGVVVAMGSTAALTRQSGLEGVLFYLAAYGLMNAGVFAVLMMLPAKSDPFVHDGQIPPATSAETFSEIAGSGRRDPALGLIMAICCFSLIGIPMTVGFFGKFFLIRPALTDGRTILVVILVLNAAISAGYYLRIIGAMFLREPRATAAPAEVAEAEAMGSRPLVFQRTVPLVLAGVASAGLSLLLGCLIPATTLLRTSTQQSGPVLPAYHAAPDTETVQATASREQ